MTNTPGHPAFDGSLTGEQRLLGMSEDLDARAT